MESLALRAKEHLRLDLKGEGPYLLALKGQYLTDWHEVDCLPVGQFKQPVVVPKAGVRKVAATQIFKALASRPFLLHL